jgi:hypothetical protein
VRSEWPDHLRWVLDLFLKTPMSEGIKATYTPRFIIASKQQSLLLYTNAGYGGWTDGVQPWLNKTLGA